VPGNRHPQGHESAQRFIDPQVLARIDNLELVARGVVDGFISGLHRSPMLGMSVDFAAHRAYLPGDDVRRIDWRLFARTDRLYIKEFEADTNTSLQLLLDISASMDYGSAALSKLDYAKYLAASLAYLSRRQRDRIGLVTFADDIVEVIPPSLRHYHMVLHALDRAAAGGAGKYLEPLAKIALNLGRRGLVVLISDLYDTPERLLGAVNQLRVRGNDLIVFHLLDPLELSLELGDISSVEDLESGDVLPIETAQYRERYRRLLEDHRTALQSGFGASRIDYIFADISQPLDSILFRYLCERERRNRVR
jgi:uncharacterized protein (DUF58 family)